MSNNERRARSEDVALAFASPKPYVTREPGRIVITLQGDVERATLPFLPEYLVMGLLIEDAEIVIDLEQVSFIDLVGIRALGREREFLRANGRKMSVRAPSREATRMINMCGLLDMVEDATIDLRRARPPLRRLVPSPFPAIRASV